MAGHPHLPKSVPSVVVSKRDIFQRVALFDADSGARTRILKMESDFRSKIDINLRSLPAKDSVFSKFFTNPFVLMAYSRQKSYSHVDQIEHDLVPAKVFSSIETSAGNMVEKVVLPVYGWEAVESSMHSHGSLLDGRRTISTGGKFECATLKSGPRTLNDDMARNLGNELVHHASSWAVEYGAKDIDFTYGVLYGTKKQSNKKDWHILRSIDDTRSRLSALTQSHNGGWSIAYKDGPLSVSATVRVGIEWWEHLGGKDTWLEVCCALIRACIMPTTISHSATYTIADMSKILDLSVLPGGYNVSILQHSQLEWLLFLARHFCDQLED